MKWRLNLLFILGLSILLMLIPHFQNPYKNEPGLFPGANEIPIIHNECARNSGITRADGLYEQASDGLPTASPSGGDSGWTGIDFGDFNGDGNDDLVVVGRKGSGPEPYISDGMGKWTYSRTGITSSWSGRSDLRIVDLNKDSNLDIITSDSGIWLGDGTGKWTEGTDTPFHGEDIDVGDYDNDNDLDVVIIGHLSGGIQAFKNDGNGKWLSDNASNNLPTDNMGGHKIRFADVNNDDNLDIIAATDYYEPVWLGDGKGNWTKAVSGITANTQWWGVSVGDIDHDDNPDIALSVFHSHTVPGGICVYRGDGSGNWTNSSGGLPATGEYGDLEFADMNNDGHLDIVAGICGFGSIPGAVNIWYGDGNGSWTIADIGLPADTDEIEGLDVGDIDNDGFLDIGIAYYGEDGVQVLRCLTPKKVNVNMKAPNGGEKIRVGTDYQIEWLASGGDSPLRVKLEFSKTGASGPFTLIAEGLKNTGEFIWNVPLFESSNCYIKISANDSSPFHSTGIDLSNSSFELYKLPVSKVTISPEPLVVIKNDFQKIEAIAFDNQNNVISAGVNFNWHLTGTIGTINPENDSNYTIFEGKRVGTGSIEVKAKYFGDEVVAQKDVLVLQRLDRLEITPSELLMIDGNSYQLTVFAYDNENSLIEDELLEYSWELSNENAKFLSGKNLKEVELLAMKTGTGELKITVHYYNMSTELTSEFKIYPRILKFMVTPSNPVVKLGESKNFTASAMGISSEDLIALTSVSWKIDKGEARIEYSSPGTQVKFIPENSGWIILNATLHYLDETYTNITHIFVPYELSRISVNPNTAFIYQGTSSIFNITAHDKKGFKIYEDLELSIDQSQYIGDIDDAEDGHSFEFNAVYKGTTTVTVTADYFGYEASAVVEVTVPPAIDKIDIEYSAGNIFVKRSVTITAVVYDMDGDMIDTGLSYNWSLPESVSDIQSHDNQVKIVPKKAGTYNVNLTVEYYGRIFMVSEDITVQRIIETVIIDPDKKSFISNSPITLTAQAFDSEGKEFETGVEYTWESTGGSLSNFEGKNIEFSSNTPGTYTVKVTARLKDYREITNSGSIILKIAPQDKESTFLEKNGKVLAISAVIAIILIVILLFLLLRKKRSAKSGVDEFPELTVPEFESAPSPGLDYNSDLKEITNYHIQPVQYPPENGQFQLGQTQQAHDKDQNQRMGYLIESK